MLPDWLKLSFSILSILGFFCAAVVLIYMIFVLIPEEKNQKNKRRLKMISINEDEILVVFKKDCGFSKAMEISEEDCELKDEVLWISHSILLVKPLGKASNILRRLNSDEYKEFIEVAVYNYEDGRYIK